MKIITKISLFLFFAAGIMILFPMQAFALLPPFERPEIPIELIKTVLTIHIFAIIFWIGGLGVRIFLLGSVKAGTEQVVRSQLYATQRRLYKQIEIPAFIIALIAGLFLVYTGVNYYQRAWFLVKMLFVVGAIIVDMVASRQFEEVKERDKEGKATGLGVALVVLAGIMVFASN